MSGNDYDNDKRPACKYGNDCYQKNPLHHEKYKHPPKKRKTDEGSSAKKSKISDYFNTRTKHKQGVDAASSSKEGRVIRDEITEQKKHTTASRENNHNSAKHGVKDDSVWPKESDDTSSRPSNSCECTVGRTKENEKEEIQSQKNQASPDTKELKDDEKDQRKSSLSIEPSLVLSISERKILLREKFLFDMPSDFFDFWEFCRTFNQQNPCDALKNVGLKLVGVYDVLAGKFDNKQSLTDEECLLHWRYYHDPPEVQTVLKGDDSQGYHIGYFRDSPDNVPSMMVSNCSNKDGVFTCAGDNIFAAVNIYLDKLKQSADPFKKMHVNKYQSALKAKAEELGLILSAKSDEVVNREKKIVARTFNKIGLVVPYNKKTQVGYRPLTIGNKELKILLDKLDKASGADRDKLLSELQPVLTYASIATDECDFGTGIELGWDIICHGVSCLNSTAARFLSTSYKLLNRDAFAKIAEAHMNNRKKGCKLSVI